MTVAKKKLLGYKACFNQLDKFTIKWCNERNIELDEMEYYGDQENDEEYIWVAETPNHPKEN